MGSSCSTNGAKFVHRPVANSTKKQRKRQLMEALAAEAKTNELLSRIPGRMCTNGSSSAACTFTQQGRKGANQDAMVVWENYASRKDTILCGVFDGHGPYGHLVARRVRDVLPSKLMSVWKARMRGEDEPDSGCEESDWAGAASDPEKESHCKEPEMVAKWRASILKSFNMMDIDLRTHPTIDCFCSGTTAVTIVKQGEDLVIANVGDSRAILGTKAEDDTLEAVQLTVDLKPNLPNEAERIRRCKGRVFALDDEPEVARVWLPYDDAPGLAMARAFGDFCLKDFGLIAVPEIAYRTLTNRDQFIVLATDGIWDVLSNKEVVDIVSKAPTRVTAARSLVEIAVRSWRLKYPTSKIDDCAAVCLYLDHEHRSMSQYKVNGVAQAQPEQLVQLSHFKEPSPTRPPTAAAPAEIDPRESWSGDVLDVDQPSTVLDTGVDGDDASLERSNTVRTPNRLASRLVTEIETARVSEIEVDKGVERSQSRRSLAECLSQADDEEWSALEGVVRVNSLLNLPRFLVGDKRAGGLKRRH